MRRKYHTVNVRFNGHIPVSLLADTRVPSAMLCAHYLWARRVTGNSHMRFLAKYWKHEFTTTVDRYQIPKKNASSGLLSGSRFPTRLDTPFFFLVQALSKL